MAKYPGNLMYKCRLCGTIFPGKKVADVSQITLTFVKKRNNELALEVGEDQFIQHQCGDDLGLGVAEFIGTKREDQKGGPVEG